MRAKISQSVTVQDLVFVRLTLPAGHLYEQLDRPHTYYRSAMLAPTNVMPATRPSGSCRSRALARCGSCLGGQCLLVRGNLLAGADALLAKPPSPRKTLCMATPKFETIKDSFETLEQVQLALRSNGLVRDSADNDARLRLHRSSSVLISLPTALLTPKSDPACPYRHSP